MSERFRIHYEINDCFDWIDIEAETVEDVRLKALIDLVRRNWRVKINDVWIERLEDIDGHD